jgi:hypothetical protein
MTIELGLTQDDLTNTQFAPVALLFSYYQRYNVLDPLNQVAIPIKTVVHSPTSKLNQVFLSILTGCRYLSEVNTQLRPESTLAQVLRIDRFADQSTLSDALDALTQMNLHELDQSVAQISARCSRTRHHDWRGFLWLDFDLSGLICGKQAEGGKKGYFSGKKTLLAANWPG